MKKFIGLLLVSLCITALIGCSRDLKNAKQAVDDMYKAYDKIDSYEETIKGLTDEEEIERLEAGIRLNEELAKMKLDDIGKYGEKLSTDELQELNDYIDEIGTKRIIDIWTK